MDSQQRGLNRAEAGAWFAQAVGAVGELLVPRCCPCCAVPVGYASPSALCPACLNRVRSACSRVGEIGLTGLDVQIFYASRYEDVMPRAILALKNAGRTDILPLLGSALAHSAYDLLRSKRWLFTGEGAASASNVKGGLSVRGGPNTLDDILLIPAPSSPESVRRRGYAPAQILAAEAARQLAGRLPNGLRVVPLDIVGYAPSPWISSPRGGAGAVMDAGRNLAAKVSGSSSREQKGLNAVGRSERMHHALRVLEPALCAGHWCVVCDDVVATGATIREMVRVLREAGATVVGACTVSSVPKKVDH